MASRFLSVGTIDVQLIDPDFNLLWKGNAKSDIDLYENQMLKLQMNAFSAIQNMSTMPKIERDGFRYVDLPFVSKIDLVFDDQITTERKVTRLENRILALEKILEDYVFNPYALRLLTPTSEEPDKN
ncbi:4465_t:CDS:2 [Dentiscutata erythropus]|uniref:4465_t:CDS:1 n=1 Tax=Dentiscutata erythropus TaxID=1348616 RepID=A0A9N9EF67_9GLOM|nr:4465_t:CDS:2 [Dentiscutata erythropus]